MIKILGGGRGERGHSGEGREAFPQGGVPKGGAPQGGAPKGGEAQNFALFSVSRSHFLSFFPLGRLLVEFWWCLKRRGLGMFTFGVLSLLCETPAERRDKKSKNGSGRRKKKAKF